MCCLLNFIVEKGFNIPEVLPGQDLWFHWHPFLHSKIKIVIHNVQGLREQNKSKETL